MEKLLPCSKKAGANYREIKMHRQCPKAYLHNVLARYRKKYSHYRKLDTGGNIRSEWRCNMKTIKKQENLKSYHGRT